MVGVNCFTGEYELEVQTTRLVPHPYDPDRRARAEERQIANLKEVKKNRDNQEVQKAVGRIKRTGGAERYEPCASSDRLRQSLCQLTGSL